MWLYVPSLSAPESEDSTSESTSLWEELSRYVTLNGNSPQPKSLRSAWKKGAFHPLRFGAISQRSMDAACEAWWTSLRQASRARITVSPGSGPGDSESMARSGISYSKRFATWNPQSSCWRTWPESGLLIAMDEQDSGTFSETWPRAGTMRNGCAFERPAWERPITAIGGSASHGDSRWTTPDAGTQCGGSTHRSIAKEALSWPEPLLRRKSHSGNWRNSPLVPCWTTPTLDDVNNITRRSGAQKSLARDAYQWRMADNPAKMFPTPSARDAKGENHSRHLAVASGRKHMDQLPNFIAHSESSPLRQIDSQNGPESSSGSHTLLRRLNPAFVSWLMGLPWWWTQPGPLSFAHSEMQSYLSRLRSLCASFCGGPASSFGDGSHD